MHITMDKRCVLVVSTGDGCDHDCGRVHGHDHDYVCAVL